MSCGCINQVGGNPAGGGVAVPNTVVPQGALVREIDPLAFTGSVNDTVILWDTAVSLLVGPALATYVTQTDSATLGTSFDISQSGIYSVLLYIPLAGGSQIQTAITYNAAGALLTGNVEPFDPECFASTFIFGSLLQLNPTQTAIIPIPQTDIDAGTAVIRAQASDVTDAAPAGAALVDPLNCCMRIFRVGDIST